MAKIQVSMSAAKPKPVGPKEQHAQKLAAFKKSQREKLSALKQELAEVTAKLGKPALLKQYDLLKKKIAAVNSKQPPAAPRFK